MASGVLEEGYGLYRNPWFLVRKKDGQYRLINSAVRLNGVTIQDASTITGCDQLTEDFGMDVILSLFD